MSEETIIETPEEVQEEVKTEQQVALEEKEAALAKREAAAEEREKELQRKSSDLGRIAKQLEEAKASVITKPEDDVEFDPTELANLKKALIKVGLDPDAVSKAVALTRATVSEQIDDIAEEFFAAHSDIPQADIIASMVESGVDFDNITAVRLKKALNAAHKAVSNAKRDVDAEVQSRLEAEIAKLKGKGEEIVSVKKGSGSGGAKTIEDIRNDPNLTPFERMNAVQGIE